MGNEFLQRTHATINAKLDRRREELACETLFTQHPECATYAAVALVRPHQHLEVGQIVTVELENDRLVVVRNSVIVADFTDTPDEILSAVQCAGGLLAAVIDDVFNKIGTVEVRLCP